MVLLYDGVSVGKPGKQSGKLCNQATVVLMAARNLGKIEE